MKMCLADTHKLVTMQIFSILIITHLSTFYYARLSMICVEVTVSLIYNIVFRFTLYVFFFVDLYNSRTYYSSTRLAYYYYIYVCIFNLLNARN